MEGSLSVPRLEFWHHGSNLRWWSPIPSERAVTPEQDPFTLQSHGDPLTNQMRHFCDVIRGTAKPILDCAPTTIQLSRAACGMDYRGCREGGSPSKFLQYPFVVKRAVIEFWSVFF
jgi:hypothetical protein